MMCRKVIFLYRTGEQTDAPVMLDLSRVCDAETEEGQLSLFFTGPRFFVRVYKGSKYYSTCSTLEYVPRAGTVDDITLQQCPIKSIKKKLHRYLSLPSLSDGQPGRTGRDVSRPRFFFCLNNNQATFFLCVLSGARFSFSPRLLFFPLYIRQTSTSSSSSSFSSHFSYVFHTCSDTTTVAHVLASSVPFFYKLHL